MPDDEPVGHWEGDVNEAVVEDWVDDTTTFERVQQVLDATTEPKSAGDVAERARVSEPTARKHLEAMADAGRAKSVQTDAGTRYLRSPTVLATRRIATIHREHSKQELREAIQELRQQLADLRETHGASDADDLALGLEADDDGWSDLARWRQLEENLEVAQAALALYDFDPDDSRSAAARAAAGSDELGTLADEDVESPARG